MGTVTPGESIVEVFGENCFRCNRIFRSQVDFLFERSSRMLLPCKMTAYVLQVA
jgi:hypothetical protein